MCSRQILETSFLTIDIDDWTIWLFISFIFFIYYSKSKSESIQIVAQNMGCVWWILIWVSAQNMGCVWWILIWVSGDLTIAFSAIWLSSKAFLSTTKEMQQLYPSRYCFSFLGSSWLLQIVHKCPRVIQVQLFPNTNLKHCEKNWIVKTWIGC